MSDSAPRLYGDLATWWPLVSHPDEYADEAVWIAGAFREILGRSPATMLELGSGGGNIASYLALHTRMTLVELSTEMIEVSRSLVPKAEHVQGDMRNVRLGRMFDAVLTHDAIMYMTTEHDLVAALTTARVHLATEGAFIVVPDYIAETFTPGVDTGGSDASDGSGVRFMSWDHAPAAGATTHDVDYAILVRSADGAVEMIHDRHSNGIFPRRTWHDAFVRAGLKLVQTWRDPWDREVFAARIAS
jgi:hypothetical protein